MQNHHRLIIAGVVVFVALAALGVPVLAYTPLLAILVLCFLLMFFMMRNMYHGSDERDDTSTGHRH